MSDPDANQGKSPLWPVPNVLGQSSENALPVATGGFELSAHYGRRMDKLSRRQFTGKATLRLHDPIRGQAAVAISDVGLSNLSYERSTGHDVVLSESQRSNLLVPVTGTLSIRNEHMQFERKDEPWILIGRGARKTTVLGSVESAFQAFVLSLPPECMGDRLAAVERLGGMVWGDASNGNDLHLARLVVALATHVSLSTETVMETGLADAWTEIILQQINNCLDEPHAANAQHALLHAGGPSLLHVQRAEALMYERSAEIHSLREIADHVGVSERTLQAAFRKERGVTPMQVLSHTKLDRARRALLDPKGPKTVSDVCLMCGIEHHGRFSKRYKEAIGEPPLATLHKRRVI